MRFLCVSSIIGTFLSGIVILVVWIVVVNDGMGSYTGGCVKRLNSFLNNMRYWGVYHNFYEIAADDYRHLFLGEHKGVYVLCVITMIFCFLGSTITGIIGFCYALLYLITGILKTIIFLCCFAVIIYRTRYDKQCESYRNMSRVIDGDDYYMRYLFDHDRIKTMKNTYRPYELLWGSSMAFIIASVYQIGCAIVLVYRETTNPPTPPQPTQSSPELSPIPTPKAKTMNVMQLGHVVHIEQPTEIEETGTIDESRSEPPIDLGISSEHSVGFEDPDSDNGTSIDIGGVDSDRD